MLAFRSVGNYCCLAEPVEQIVICFAVPLGLQDEFGIPGSPDSGFGRDKPQNTTGIGRWSDICQYFVESRMHGIYGSCRDGQADWLGGGAHVLVKSHIGKAANKGMKAVLALRRI